MKSKYKAKLTMYDGRRYASKLEAKRAQQLDLLEKAGEIEWWKPQVSMPLFTVDTNGVKIEVGKYIIDFKVYDTDGSYHYEEVKGYQTPLWKLKYKIWTLANPDEKIIILRKQDI